MKSKLVFFFILSFTILSINSYAHISDVIYDDSELLEFYVTIDIENWYDSLMADYYDGQSTDDWIYTPATFTFNGVDYDSVGIRFKGYKSMGYPSEKKPFKIKFNEFIEDQEFYGVDKLALSNGYADPSFIREKMVYDVLNKFIPSSRSNFVKLYINDQYWGLYTNVEVVNMKFIDKNFGDNEDGNLFKGDPHGDFIWYGEEQENYYDRYELKTNEEANDWSDLIELIYTLEYTAIEDFPEIFEEMFNVHNFLFFLTINNFFVNLDSYVGNSRNYYVYHRTDIDRILHLPWDFNFAFGTLTMGLSVEQLFDLDIFWEHTFPRPLVNMLFDVDEYRDIYLMDYKYLIDNELDYTTYAARVDELGDLIRDAVYADTLKMYTDGEFETNLEDGIPFGNGELLGIKEMIQERISSVEDQLNGYQIPERITGIVLNEFMADNDSTITDDNGEYSDWIELYNTNDFEVDLSGLFLTDNIQTPARWKIPDTTIVANGYLVIWADNDTLSENFHTNFSLNDAGEFLGLYARDGIIPIDSLNFDNQHGDISYGRYPDGEDAWGFMLLPTPGSSNNYTNSPPEISNLAQVPLSPTSSDQVNITAQITDNSTLSSVYLKYDAGSGFVDITMYDDGSHGDGAASDDVYGGYIPAQTDETLVSYYIEATDDESVVITYPEDAPTVTFQYSVGYELPDICINEFMADNDNIIADPEGDYDDWLEIYNYGAEDVDIGGMYLTDDLSDPTEWWQIPTTSPTTTTISAGEFLLIWADSDEEVGVLHLNFKLANKGEQIGLFAFYGTTPIDTLTYDLQTTNISYGRYPDGSESWELMSVFPTPGSSNIQDYFPPTIENVNQNPTAPSSDDDVNITATITDEGTVTSAILKYDAGSGFVDVTMYDDGSHGDGAASDDVYGGYIPSQIDETLVNYYIEATNDISEVATYPANAPSTTLQYVVGYALPEIYINEFMASNTTTIADPQGQYDDWIELYNASDEPIDVGGMYITDDLSDPTKWQIPSTNPDSTTISAAGFLLLWADNDSGDGELHLGFELKVDGEQIGLYSLYGIATIDTITYATQTTDVSYGRSSNGGENWEFLSSPSPGSSNTSEPDINVYPLLLDETLTQDDTVIDTIQITNIGDPSSSLTYSISWGYTKLGREISGSTFESDVTEYSAGTNFDIIFTVYNGSTDTEWLTDATLDFPSGVSVNSSTDFVGGTGDLVSDNNTGDGVMISWTGNDGSWGNIRDGETATSTVNVTVRSGFSGDMVLDWTLIGDQYGSSPHEISGQITLTEGAGAPESWLTVEPISGDCGYNETDNIVVTLNSSGLDLATYTATISVANNAGTTIEIPVTLIVSESIELDTPTNVVITVDETNITISWDSVEGAASYNVYSSDNPIDGFALDESGIFDGASWTTSISETKKFYRVTAENYKIDNSLRKEKE
ncbi:MAG: CotH kinase family protein [Candidatus Cloacimonetes bacterium]|nr:CotH kinase family protein [Candidatus Cloacimonadota bacterium]